MTYFHDNPIHASEALLLASKTEMMMMMMMMTTMTTTTTTMTTTVESYITSYEMACEEKDSLGDWPI
jgi:hypothetical protein